MPTTEQPGCLGFLFKLFPGLAGGNGGGAGGASAEAEPLPYRRKDCLLSPAERSFFGVLEQTVGAEHRLFAKVRIADIIEVRKGTDSWQRHFNRISAKHIDFLLCDTDSLRPILAIELDDSSHQRGKRIERDSFVDEALAAAGLRLLRVKARAAYNVEEVRKAIGDILRGSGGAGTRTPRGRSA